MCRTLSRPSSEFDQTTGTLKTVTLQVQLSMKVDQVSQNNYIQIYTVHNVMDAVKACNCNFPTFITVTENKYEHTTQVRGSLLRAHHIRKTPFIIIYEY